MKRKIIVQIAIIALLGITGCGKTEPEVREPENVSTHVEPDKTKSSDRESPELWTDTVTEEQANPVDTDGGGTGVNEESKIDFTQDYSEAIKTDVDTVVSSSESLQEELEKIDEVIQKYKLLAQAAQTQTEMKMSSEWFFQIWDTELNNLWGRISNSADPQTKEGLLAEQRNWVAMKEEAVLENLGSREENGSIYPLLVNAFLEEITKTRSYILANELAKLKGETFVMPEPPAKYGYFVDNQGIGSVFSSLLTRPGMEGIEENDEAYMGIYRLGVLEGTFVDSGDGELAFTSNDGMVKGIIRINGWDGATFTVTESEYSEIFSAGQEFDFPFVF